MITCGLVVGTNVSEEHAACIFRVGVSQVGKVVDYIWVEVGGGGRHRLW